jgi:hypothetical protein
VFIDFIAHVHMLQDVLRCSICANHFGKSALQSFLERLWVVLPCPLNEPGPLEGRRGLPFRVNASLPATVKAEEKARCRLKFLGKAQEKKGILILRSTSSWQADLADRGNLHLKEYFADLLALYLEDFPRPVTLVSLSDRHRLRPPTNGRQLKVINIPNLSPQEYQTLQLSADLILTDNEISYSLGNAVGKTPAMVLVNSFSIKELMEREGRQSALGRLLREIQGKWPHSVFPHLIYPLKLSQNEVMAGRGAEARNGSPSKAFLAETIRLGRMPSSPFLRAELYGGEQTKNLLHRVLLDSSARQELLQQELSYLNRLNQIEEGVSVLKQVQAGHRLSRHTVL